VCWTIGAARHNNPCVAQVVLTKATKLFETTSGSSVALDHVDLVVDSGELLLLTGPSGSGKTTLLRLIAGLERPTDGKVQIGGADMADVPPHARNVAMVFQNPALYPHMTVRQNIEFGLKLRGCAHQERSRRISEISELLCISDLLGRRPAQLSGGQAQRVALARAWVRRPDVFLLDEPFASLEPAMRAQLRNHVLSIQASLRATTVLVSHDPADIAGFGGRIALVRSGKLVQIGKLADFRSGPANIFVERYVRDWAE
jgi:multiple sugar transport system ATP-binding protein